MELELIGVRIPPKMASDIRKRAIDDKTSLQGLITKLIEKYLKTKK